MCPRVRNRAVATLLVAIMLASAFVPFLAFVPSSAAAASNTTGNNTTTEDFDTGLNAWSQTNVSTSGGVVSLNVTNVTVDNFADNDISEYGGAESFAVIESRAVMGGTLALNMTNDGTNKIIAGNASNFTHRTEQGDTITVDVYPNTNATAWRVYFGAFGVMDTVTGPPNGYFVLYNSNGIYLRERVDGSDVQNTGADGSPFHTGEKIEVQVKWHDNGSINASLRFANNSTLIGKQNFTSTNFTSGGIGFHSNSGGGNGYALFDNYTATNASSTGEFVKRYNTSKKARLAKLNWSSTETNGNIKTFVRFGATGSYTEVTGSKEAWQNLSDGKDVFVRVNFTAGSGKSPTLDNYTLEHRTWTPAIYTNVTQKVAYNHPSVALKYYDDTSNETNITDNFIIDITNDANLTVSTWNFSADENVTEFTVNMSSGTMNVTLSNLSDDTYDVYQDGEIHKDNVTVDNGILRINKSSNWSKHSFRVTRVGGTTDGDGLVGGGGCASGQIQLPFVGCVDLPVVGAVGAVVAIVGYFVFKEDNAA